MVLMGHGTFHSNTVYFALITGLIEYRKKLAKITAKSKKKTRQSLKTDVSDFKTECTKMFLMKLYQHGSNFRQKFRPVLKCSGRVTEIHLSLPLHSLKTKD